LLMIKGLGPGKVKAIWKGLGIESPGELLYACHENRLVELSGFGLKTQAEIRKQLEYHLESSGKYLWAAIEPEAIRISGQIRDALDAHVDWVGEFARKCPVVQKLEMVTDCEEDIPRLLTGIGVQVENEAPPYV